MKVVHEEVTMKVVWWYEEVTMKVVWWYEEVTMKVIGGLVI